ncbi:MAG TPA: hypothetical protein VJ728_01265 [Candidatus Binataceae bacterium]|nr:hypothetical protein [Candidatus Binataceae bacterium]
MGSSQLAQGDWNAEDIPIVGGTVPSRTAIPQWNRVSVCSFVLPAKPGPGCQIFDGALLLPERYQQLAILAFQLLRKGEPP